MNTANQTPERSLGLYLHIPFCEQKCLYCDFYSLPRQIYEEANETFVEALITEIRLSQTKIPRDFPVDTVYVGGGTPSLLTSHQLANVMSALEESFQFSKSVEITIEANPGTVSAEKLSGYREAGINRLSIGVQTVNDHLLSRLGRIHTACQCSESIETARSAGFTNVSVDLIFGIPGQTLADWERTLQAVLDWNVEHLSIYNLIYEENTPFYTLRKAGKLRPLPEEEEARMFRKAMQLLETAGYHQYEISNFARPGFECRHNLRYWEHLPYLGFGPSAHSFLPPVRWWNLPDIHGYTASLKKHTAPPSQQEELSGDELLDEWIYLQLRQTRGLDLGRLRQQFNLKVDWPSLLETTIGKDWDRYFQLTNESLRFSTEGMWLSDELIARLLVSIPDSTH